MQSIQKTLSNKQIQNISEDIVEQFYSKYRNAIREQLKLSNHYNKKELEKKMSIIESDFSKKIEIPGYEAMSLSQKQCSIIKAYKGSHIGVSASFNGQAVLHNIIKQCFKQAKIELQDKDFLDEQRVDLVENHLQPQNVQEVNKNLRQYTSKLFGLAILIDAHNTEKYYLYWRGLQIDLLQMMVELKEQGRLNIDNPQDTHNLYQDYIKNKQPQEQGFGK
jgi:hypothetical protein